MRRLRPPGLPALFTLVFVAGGWCAGLVRLSDNSFLWHLRTGHLILDEGIPRSDPYSFTVPGIKWVAQSWLAEVLYAWVDDMAGPWGIRVLTALCGALLAGTLYRLALRFARNRIRAALVTLLALRTVLTIWSERPLLFGLLGVLLFVWIVEVPESWVGRRAWVVVPAGVWLFANLHGTWILGVGYLGLHLVGRWIEGSPPWIGRERTLAVAALAGTAAVVVNPYGIDLLVFPVRLVMRGETLNTVAEWTSPDFRSQAGMIFGAWILCFVALAVLGRHRPGVRDVLVTLPFLFMALWALRNIGIAAIVMLPVVARTIATDEDRPDARLPIGWLAGAVLIAFASVWTVSASRQPDYDLRDYPVEAMRALEERGDLGRRVFMTDAWAGYTIAKYWPDQRVFMDDRFDTYPRRIVAEYSEIAGVEPRWSRLLDEHEIDVVVWPGKRGLTQALAEAEGWDEVHRDDVAVVFVRERSGREEAAG